MDPPLHNIPTVSQTIPNKIFNMFNKNSSYYGLRKLDEQRSEVEQIVVDLLEHIGWGYMNRLRVLKQNGVLQQIGGT